ncbi:MAG: glycosyltransferase [Bifidobacteriaceae bacterium]|jgi:galactofuranosylgalactofuranosylrhamnosyl-N-acetylglucosaminyl-diphospho-decaprenol beta-1,5/1,6-galactofuranosyltransferase|nr:glycosyltransferase [Bifidobacteriaceae bacterium]
MKTIKLQRIKFPIDEPPEALPIYVPLKSTDHSLFLSRDSMKIPAGREISFASYFNAFPASYYLRNTDLRKVGLNIKLNKKAKIRIFTSDYTGVYTVHESFPDVDKLETQLSIESYWEGGWIWFNIEAPPKSNVILEEAYWSAEVPDDFELQTMNVSITTLNKRDYVIEKLKLFSENIHDMEFLGKIFVVDQGSEKVKGHKEFEKYAKKLGSRLEVIEQENLGGAGGFSRGMYESAYNSPADNVMLLDDDTTLEIESFRRSIMFETFCSHPTIVGSHMFWTNDLPVLNNYAERMRLDYIKWRRVKGTKKEFDISDPNLKGTSWLHRYFEVNYNGWWMCLIPTKIIRKIGMSLPFFIKWDDSEFCYRALTYGYKTVSFPTSFTWHENWKVKTDAIDWQAYYHFRNRLVTALLHGTSFYPLVFLLDLLISGIKDTVIFRYSSAHQKIMAMQNVLSGPKAVAEDLPVRLGIIKKTRAEFQDAKFYLPENLPPTKRVDYLQRMNNPAIEAFGLVMGFFRQFLPTRKDAEEYPDLRLMPKTSKIYKIVNTDASIYTFPDGLKTQLLVRDRKEFVKIIPEFFLEWTKIALNWYKLRQVYRVNAKRLSSKKTWEGYFL